MDFDPYQDYEIKTLNPNYSGTAFGVDFQKGYARVYGLPQDADQEAIAHRKWSLLEMEASGNGVFSQEDADGRPQRTRGRVYTIAEFDPRKATLKCKECGRTFDSQSQLDGHSGQHMRRAKEEVPA